MLKRTAIVINSGSIFSTSDNIAQQLGATKYVNGDSFGKGFNGKYDSNTKVNVINDITIANDTYYLIEKDNQQWVIGERGLDNIGISETKPHKFLVMWEIQGCGDPTEFFYTLINAKKKAADLSQDNNVIISSIKIIEIKTIWEVNPSITIEKVK